MAASPQAPPQVVDVTLSLFGGRKTDIAPADIPEGLSPDEQDNVFLPGDVENRPGLGRLYAAGQLPAGTSVLYAKTYVQPNNDPLTLILTSDGQLWVEDVGNSPGTVTLLGSVPPGLSAQSVSAFGREYIAISDLLHGQGVPLQFDGTHLDRVTQDGPGAAPSAADENQTYALSNSPGGLFAVPAMNVGSGSQANYLVTLVLNGPIPIPALNSFQSGDEWLVAGVASGYNGTWPIISATGGGFIPGLGAYTTLTITYLATTTGLAPVAAGGTVTTPYYNVITNPAGAFQPAINSQVTIASAGVAGYDGTWGVRYIQTHTPGLATPNPLFTVVIAGQFALANSGGGTVSIAGNISVGTHQFVVMYLTRQGSLTPPSPVGSWNAAGSKRVVLTNVPIGPANIVARVFGFTGAGGDNYFSLPSQVTLPQISGPPIIIQALIIPDNTTTTVTLDFSDDALFAGIAIDQVGNDLFDQRVLGPVLGFFAYASRLACWGDFQKVENFLNMGFDGGVLPNAPQVPSGWTSGDGNTTLVPGGAWTSGAAVQIIGSGAVGPYGILTQPAYQDGTGTAILLPSTSYIARLWMSWTGTLPFGGIIVEFFSPSLGSLAIAAISLSQLPAGNPGRFVQAPFNAQTPAVIPADTILRVYSSGLLGVPATTVVYDELQLVYAQNPYNNTLAHLSYTIDPEGFAQTTGNLGAADDQSPIRCFALQRLVALLKTAEGRYAVQDNDFEPDQWNVETISRATGAVSLRAGDPGKFGEGDGAVDWDVTASKDGLYLYAGADFWKISQEISRGTLPQSQDPRPTWDDINWAQQQTICLKNDTANRRILIAVPLNGALTPSHVFVMDYRELDTAVQIAASPPLHVTLTNKMKSSDLTRKWSVWNISASTLEVIVRPGNQKAFVFGGGPRNGVAYGNIYSLDPTKLSDDDYGAMFPYYTTYAFVDHDQEQGLGLGSARHFTKKINLFVAGVGSITITPIVNSLYNFQPQTSPRILTLDTDQSNFLSSDLEWTVNIRGQRVFYRIQVSPLPGSTDVKYRLQKFIAWIMKDPIALFRSSGI